MEKPAELQSRYPGPKPFKTEQQNVFYGRDKDVQALYEIIGLERMVVLFGKSGLGKSSLINAGVVPKIEARGRLTPVSVRFEAFSGESGVMPAEKTRRFLELTLNQNASFLDRLTPGDRSLWALAKNFQVLTKNGSALLFLFDQFEELFTYPAEHVAAFKQEFAELMKNQVPARFSEALEKQYAEGRMTFSEAELEALHLPLNAKALIAIRSDRLSLLEKLTDALPILLKNMFELQPLSAEDARLAIQLPARNPSPGRFSSPPFEYAPGALDKIIAFLTDNSSERIESTQLQIICQSAEKKVRALHTVVTETDLGDLEQVIQNYYFDTIAELGDAADQAAARKLIEDGLIFEEEERRLSMYEGQIYRSFNIRPEVLQKLVDAHLLRAEPSLQGGYTYELSHDTLVAPVLKAKTARVAAEKASAEKARLEKEQAEKDQLLEDAKKQAAIERRRTQSARALAAAALAGLAIAVWFYIQADRATGKANLERDHAQKSENTAVVATKLAEQNAAAATAARKEAEKNSALANEQKGIAAGALHQAEQNLQKAVIAEAAAKAALTDALTANTKVVIQFLKEINQHIQDREYEIALPKCASALSLKVEKQKPEIVKRLLEIAYVFTEADTAAAAIQALNLIKPDNFSAKTHHIRQNLLSEIRSLCPAGYFDFLEARYYPKMIAVEGGAFNMGSPGIDSMEGIDSSEIPQHLVKLSSFKIAETETTVWQYFLYRKARYKEVGNDRRGLSGDQPISDVSWYDAIEYCNWISRQKAIDSVYAIDTTRQDPNNLSRYDELKWTITPRGSNGYRLPTEAEWEFAARGGVQSKGYKYSGSDNIDSVAWFNDNSQSQAHSAAQKRPNELGIFDMSGNVWEWCFDWYDEKYYKNSPLQNPVGAFKGSYRVFRGGSWYGYARYCRSSHRYGVNPTNRSGIIGFRVASGRQ